MRYAYGAITNTKCDVPNPINITACISPDTFSHIMQYIDQKDAVSLRSVCRHIQNLMQCFKSVLVNSVVDDSKREEYVKYVTYDSNFDGDLSKLPRSVTHVTFKGNHVRSMSKLPKHVTHITFGKFFNQNVDNLPNHITHITFGDDFNQSVDKLPNSVIHITFGGDFEQIVNNLPNSTTHLTFGCQYHNYLDHVPESIIHRTAFSYPFRYRTDKYKTITYILRPSQFEMVPVWEPCEVLLSYYDYRIAYNQ